MATYNFDGQKICFINDACQDRNVRYESRENSRINAKNEGRKITKVSKSVSLARRMERRQNEFFRIAIR